TRVQYVVSALCVFLLGARRPPSSTLFPTRRSSDLIQRKRIRGAAVIGFGRHDSQFAQPLQGLNQGFQAWRRIAIVVRNQNPHCRSEEHTSELQSRENLVCRLLLEKKKTVQTLHYYD